MRTIILMLLVGLAAVLTIVFVGGCATAPEIKHDQRGGMVWVNYSEPLTRASLAATQHFFGKGMADLRENTVQIPASGEEKEVLVSLFYFKGRTFEEMKTAIKERGCRPAIAEEVLTYHFQTTDHEPALALATRMLWSPIISPDRLVPPLVMSGQLGGFWSKNNGADFEGYAAAVC